MLYKGEMHQHVRSHQILSMTAKIQAMNLGNIISLVCLFVKKKLSFQEYDGTKQQKVGSSFRKPQMCHANKLYISKTVLLCSFRKASAALPFSALHLNTYRGYKLCKVLGIAIEKSEDFWINDLPDSIY